MDHKNIILGAGLAGLSTAYHLNEEYAIYEKQSEIGGLTRSVHVDGFTFDYAPHILIPQEKYASKLIKGLLKNNLEFKKRESYIYHKDYDVYTQFPFQANLYGLPKEVILDCLKGVLEAQKNKNGVPPKHYEDWIYQRFGKGIAEQLMIPYAKKIWTVSPTTMNYDWVDKRVPEPDFEVILEGALTDLSKRIGIHSEFWAVKSGGIEALPKALSRNLKNIHVNMKASKIFPREKKVEFNFKVTKSYERLISSLPLPLLIDLMEDVPSEVRKAANELACNSIVCVTLGVDRENISQHHWDYFHEDGFIFHRLSFPMNFSKKTVPDGKSSICCEIAYSKYRGLPVKGKENIIKRTIDDLIKAKILHRDDKIIMSNVISMKYAYVIYDLNHRKNTDTVLSFLESMDIYGCGRFGEWEYYNMDHSIMSGKRIADRINNGFRKIDEHKEKGTTLTR